MPNLDMTGPAGLGPMTGRGLGYGRPRGVYQTPVTQNLTALGNFAKEQGLKLPSGWSMKKLLAAFRKRRKRESGMAVSRSKRKSTLPKSRFFGTKKS